MSLSKFSEKSRGSVIPHALFILLLLLFHRFDALRLFNSHLLGGNGPDTNLYFWIVSTFPYNLVDYGWFETNAFYPYNDTLAWSDCFLLPSSVFYVFRHIFTLTEIQSWNCIILLAQFLNGFLVFLLAGHLGGKTTVNLLLASLFILSSYFTEHLGHPQLQFFFFLPLGLLLFHRLLSAPDYKKSILFALTLTATFLTSAYYAIGLSLVCFILFALQLTSDRKLTLMQIKSLSLSFITSGILLFPFLLPYLSTKQLFGPRGLHEFYHFSLSGFSFLAGSPLSEYFSFTSELSHSEAHFGWGIACALLLLMAFSRIWKTSPWILLSFLSAIFLADKEMSSFLYSGRELRLYLSAFFAWLCLVLLIRQLWQKKQSEGFLFYASGIIICLLAIGPLGYKEIHVLPCAPFTLFFKLFPGFDSLRAISRLGSLAILLFCSGNIPLLNRLNFSLLLLFPVLLLDAASTATPLAPLSEKPQIFNALSANYIKGEAALVLPVSGQLDKNNNVISWSELAELNSSYLVDLRFSREKLLNGYSGQRPKSVYQLPKISKNFPNQQSLEKLLEFKDLNLLVVLGSRISGFSSAKFSEQLKTLEPQLSLITSVGDDFLLRINR